MARASAALARAADALADFAAAVAGDGVELGTPGAADRRRNLRQRSSADLVADAHVDDVVVEAVVAELAERPDGFAGTTEDLWPAIERQVAAAGYSVPGRRVFSSAKHLGRRLGIAAGRIEAEGIVVGHSVKRGKARWAFTRAVAGVPSRAEDVKTGGDAIDETQESARGGSNGAGGSASGDA